jgi:hypothetical protein
MPILGRTFTRVVKSIYFHEKHFEYLNEPGTKRRHWQLAGEVGYDIMARESQPRRCISILIIKF